MPVTPTDSDGLAALAAAVARDDLLGIRDALAAYGEVLATDHADVVAAAEAKRDELLASTVNDRHEEWLEAQEWPSADNGHFSRKNHPLYIPLRRPWPKPANAWPPSMRTANMRQEAWLEDPDWPSRGWLADDAPPPAALPAVNSNVLPWPLLPQEMPPPSTAAPPASKAASEAALLAATRARDLIGLRDAIRAHAEAAAGTQILEEAIRLRDFLLEKSTANDRHEDWLEAQEWPGPSNGWDSRVGHPLTPSSPYRHARWPKHADWPPASCRPRSPPPPKRCSFHYVEVRHLSELTRSGRGGTPLGALGAGRRGSSSSVALEGETEYMDELLRGRRPAHSRHRAAPADARDAATAGGASRHPRDLAPSSEVHLVGSAPCGGSSKIGVTFQRNPTKSPGELRRDRAAAQRRTLVEQAHAAVASPSAREEPAAAARADARTRVGWQQGQELHRQAAPITAALASKGYRPGSAAARRVGLASGRAPDGALRWGT